MNNTKELIQPLIINDLAGYDVTDKYITGSTSMYIYEFVANKASITLNFIPSTFSEWIIGYNNDNSKSCFICIGMSEEITPVKLSGYDKYFCIRFADNSCYYNKQIVKATPADMMSEIFNYSPTSDSYEYKLVSCFKDSKSFDERISLFKNFLKESKSLCKLGDIVSELREDIISSKGTFLVGDSINKYEYSIRHLTRLFKASLGVNLKTYCRYVRFQCALSLLLSNKITHNYELIEILDYSDTAHFQREFKYFTGMTPKKYLAAITNK